MAPKKPAPAKPAARKPVKRPPPAKPAPERAPAEPFHTSSPEAAYAHFLPLAAAVSAEPLDPCRADPEIVRANLERGINAVRPELEMLRRKLPDVPIGELLELPALALALAHAAGRVAKPALGAEVEKRFALMRPMREAALRQLEVFALIDLIPAHVPAAIRRGTGMVDAAEDAVAIPTVFHDNEELIGYRHPFTSAMLKKLGEDGEWLLQRLAAFEAEREGAEKTPAARVRDQLWALLVERHELLRQAGAVLFGVKNLDALVPPLLARHQALPA